PGRGPRRRCRRWRSRAGAGIGRVRGSGRARCAWSWGVPAGDWNWLHQKPGKWHYQGPIGRVEMEPVPPAERAMYLQLDDNGPLHAQLARALKAAMLGGGLGAGTRL